MFYEDQACNTFPSKDTFLITSIAMLSALRRMDEGIRRHCDCA